VSSELLGNTVPGSLKIYPACKIPSLSLSAAQTLAINIASPSGRDQGKKPSWGKAKKKNPPAAFFGGVFSLFI